ncbi:cytochrome P450 [Streptomyces sp. DSM 41524]|uniref:Cytochrome P450 n=1 Tax=Streptomyces asiaticus subsp. ignotus TaxID=3098222 RepID=A0ABU7Q3W1_9ACTN|nr:cytochrome P450 [Streptomyces sp. DSM 41524]
MNRCPVEINYPSLEGAENPYPLYGWLREEAPVYQNPGTTDFLVTRYEDVTAVARDYETFSSVGSRSLYNPFNETGDGKATESLIEADPPGHRVKRDFCGNAFKPRQLSRRRGMITEICHELIDKLDGRTRIDFVADFAEPLPLLVLTDMMGFSRADLEWLDGWSRVDNGGLSFLPPEVQELQRVSAHGATEYLTRTILRRAEEPGDDELSGMIQHQVARDGALDLDYIRDNAVTLIRGGVITTAHLISATMRELVVRPARLSEVREDFSRIPAVLEETLRMESPVQWAPRRATRDTSIGGVAIPAGARVLIMLGAANRDESEFAEADEFAPERANVHSNIAFGVGPHFCLGAPLARLEARIAFETFLTRVRDIQLVPGQKLDHAPSAQFRGLNELLIDIDLKADADV